ncbi:MAG: hypothetical protein NC453_15805 [Muribaculum sp.]|nr:hypothetical protein [Muribaculum sp.]
MTGLEIFLVGGLFASTSVLAGVMYFDKKKSSVIPPKDETAAKPKEDASEEKPMPQKSMVGKSKTDVSAYEVLIAKSIEKAVEKVLPAALSELLGDVNLKDVEFGKTSEPEEATPETESEATSNQQEETNETKYQPMDSAATEAAFNTDLRDVEDEDYPSAPSAAGVPIEDIENAVNTVYDKTATESEMAVAGKTLKEFEGTQLEERLKADDEISKRIDLCVRLSIRAEIQAKSSGGNRVVKSAKVEKDTKLNLPDSFEDFDVSSIFQ